MIGRRGRMQPQRRCNAAKSLGLFVIGAEILVLRRRSRSQPPLQPSGERTDLVGCVLLVDLTRCSEATGHLQLVRRDCPSAIPRSDDRVLVAIALQRQLGAARHWRAR